MYHKFKRMLLSHKPPVMGSSSCQPVLLVEDRCTEQGYLSASGPNSSVVGSFLSLQHAAVQSNNEGCR